MTPLTILLFSPEKVILDEKLEINPLQKSIFALHGSLKIILLGTNFLSFTFSNFWSSLHRKCLRVEER
jgi:hypothetical protein